MFARPNSPRNIRKMPVIVPERLGCAFPAKQQVLPQLLRTPEGYVRHLIWFQSAALYDAGLGNGENGGHNQHAREFEIGPSVLSHEAPDHLVEAGHSSEK